MLRQYYCFQWWLVFDPCVDNVLYDWYLTVRLIWKPSNNNGYTSVASLSTNNQLINSILREGNGGRDRNYRILDSYKTITLIQQANNQYSAKLRVGLHPQAGGQWGCQWRYWLHYTWSSSSKYQEHHYYGMGDESVAS